MNVKEKLREDMKAAMRAKDQPRLSAIRMAQNSIKNREIDLRRELGDAEAQALLASEIKKRREAAEQFENAGRDDLAGKEKAEAEVLAAYLPEQLSGDEIRGLVKEAVTEAGAASMKDIGKVMKILMPRVKGKADGGEVNRIVKELLES